MKDREEEHLDLDLDLALFLEMRNDVFLLPRSSPPTPGGSKAATSPIFHNDSSPTSTPTKNPYDWLLTPPRTPFLSSLEMESQQIIMSQNRSPKEHQAELTCKFTACKVEPASRESCAFEQISPPRLDSSNAGSSRPSSSDSQISVTSKSGTERCSMPPSTKPSRVVMSTSRAITPSSKPINPTVTSTIPSARTSEPMTRSKLRTCKPTSKSGTPTRRPSNTSIVTSRSVPPRRSSSVGRMDPKATRNTMLSHGTSTVRPTPQNPSEMPGLSTDAPQNSKTLKTKRPVSTSRCRSEASISNGRLGQCSPLKGRSSNGSSYNHRRSFPAVRLARSHDEDEVSPVMIGTKMVERVVNMRKLAPPKNNNQYSNNLVGKSSSHSSSGFGRTLSKSSLDMALRHMDIGQSIAGNLKPLKTKLSGSSKNSVKLGAASSRSDSVSGSPFATSSNASSEVSFNSNTLSLDTSEAYDDLPTGRK